MCLTHLDTKHDKEAFAERLVTAEEAKNEIAGRPSSGIASVSQGTDQTRRHHCHRQASFSSQNFRLGAVEARKLTMRKDCQNIPRSDRYVNAWDQVVNSNLIVNMIWSTHSSEDVHRRRKDQHGCSAFFSALVLWKRLLEISGWITAMCVACSVVIHEAGICATRIIWVPRRSSRSTWFILECHRLDSFARLTLYSISIGR
ncbi:hypothetical protein B0H10DRAFT_662914 [Mycena sp. CBHHK59/15]|nr:hypothetical protein B0H10DRAFT_662914 [Mycena sp. CBHHK59/15]